MCPQQVTHSQPGLGKHRTPVPLSLDQNPWRCHGVAPGRHRHASSFLFAWASTNTMSQQDIWDHGPVDLSAQSYQLMFSSSYTSQMEDGEIPLAPKEPDGVCPAPCTSHGFVQGAQFTLCHFRSSPSTVPVHPKYPQLQSVKERKKLKDKVVFQIEEFGLIYCVI